MVEKRVHPRIDVTGSGIEGSFTSLAQFLDFFAENISEGGMKVSSKQFFPEHSTFHFKLDLGEKDPPFEGMGQVMWVDRTLDDQGRVTMGVQFVHLTEPSTELVKIIERAHASEK